MIYKLRLFRANTGFGRCFKIAPNGMSLYSPSIYALCVYAFEHEAYIVGSVKHKYRLCCDKIIQLIRILNGIAVHDLKV